MNRLTRPRSIDDDFYVEQFDNRPAAVGEWKTTAEPVDGWEEARQRNIVDRAIGAGSGAPPRKVAVNGSKVYRAPATDWGAAEPPEGTRVPAAAVPGVAVGDAGFDAWLSERAPRAQEQVVMGREGTRPPEERRNAITEPAPHLDYAPARDRGDRLWMAQDDYDSPMVGRGWALGQPDMATGMPTKRPKALPRLVGMRKYMETK